MKTGTTTDTGERLVANTRNRISRGSGTARVLGARLPVPHVPRTAAPHSPAVLSMPQSALSRRTCGESAKRQGTARSRKRGGHNWRSDDRT